LKGKRVSREKRGRVTRESACKKPFDSRKSEKKSQKEEGGEVNSEEESRLLATKKGEKPKRERPLGKTVQRGATKKRQGRVDVRKYRLGR